MKLVDRHLLGSFVPPFFFGLSVTTFLLMIEVFENYINLFIEKGIRFGVATEILGLSLGHTFALTIPMAVMVGVLMGVGHLAGDQEITALKACGVSLYRITRPLFIAGTLLTVAMIAYNHFVLPHSNHRLRNRLFEVQRLRPTFKIQPNTFVDISDDYTIFVRHKDDQAGTLRDVILYQREGRGDPVPDVIVAETGVLESVSPGYVSLDLYNGEYHQMPDAEDPLSYSRTRFSKQTVWVDLELDRGGTRAIHRRGEREMDLTMLANAVDHQDSLATANRGSAREILSRFLLPLHAETDTTAREALSPQRNALDEYRSLLGQADRTARQLALNAQTTRSYEVRRNRYSVEWHKKFSIPVACIVFVVLGVPLAIVSSRGGKGVSVGLSILAFLVYYLFISLGEKLADRGLLTPWLSMWAPNLVLGAAGALLLQKTVQETKIVHVELPGRLKRILAR